MEVIVLVGIPGSGKTTLACERFPKHKRINLDTLHTRNREEEEIANCLRGGNDLVIDNTNTTLRSRNKYIQTAKLFGLPIKAVYLRCPLDLAIARNASRTGKERVPDRAVIYYNKILQPPSVDEGFDDVETIDVA